MVSKEEMLEDIKRMLIILQAITPPETQGEDYLNELKDKYINSSTSHNTDYDSESNDSTPQGDIEQSSTSHNQ